MVVSSALCKIRHLLQLGTADGRLHVRRLQVVAEVGIDILVVVACRQLAVLAVKAMAAGVVLSGRAHAVPAPVPEGPDDAVKERIVSIDRAALAHGHVMGRVKAGGTDITDGSGEFLLPVQLVGAAERIAVVLHQPQAVLSAESQNPGQVEGIAQRMGNHHCLCLFGQCALESTYIDIVLRNGDIHKDRNRPVLNHRGNRGGKSRRHGDDLIAALNLPLS